MKPELILHIGTEKTGTTSIQVMLHSHHDELLKEGVLIPQSMFKPSHIQFTVCAFEDEPEHNIWKAVGLRDEAGFTKHCTKVINRIKEEINDYNPKKIIISDEHINIYLDSEKRLSRFKELCDEIGVVTSVIIYLRRQDEFRLAMLSEGVKRNNPMLIDPNYILPCYPDIPYRFNYLQIVDKFASLFGKEKIVIRIYDRKSLVSHDICSDFLALTGLKLKYDASKHIIKNRSVDARIIVHISCLFQFLQRIKLGSTIIKNFIVDVCEIKYRGQKIWLGLDRHVAFMRQFEMINNELCRKYLKNQDGQGELFVMEKSKVMDLSPQFPQCTVPGWLFYANLCYCLAVKLLGLVRFVDLIGMTNVKRKSAKLKNIFYKIFHKPEPNPSDVIKGTCLVCGSRIQYSQDISTREVAICKNCNATGRDNCIAYSISNIICNKIISLKDHKVNKNIKIVGLSDGLVYADILQKKYDYINTFYHCEPRLNISDPPHHMFGKYDILISTEVIEHVLGRTLDAFNGSIRLLKPGGIMIFSVPYTLEEQTLEHYRSDLVDYKPIQDDKGNWLVELHYADGGKEIDHSPIFHGGPGATLEIRRFNLDRLMYELEWVGFEDITVLVKNMPEHGINWEPWSRMIVATKPAAK